MRLSVACCQVAVDVDDPDGGAGRAAAAVAAAAARGARLVVLPELVTCGYAFADVEEARRIGAGDPRRLQRIASAAPEVVVVAGWCEVEGDVVHNSASLVWGGQVRATYRKTHLWDTEKDIFGPGDDPPPVVETPVGRVGVAICYDVEFPEVVRGLRERGAQIVAAPVNWPLLPQPPDSVAIEVIKAQAAAAAYRIPMAVADRCGPERGVDWVGGSCVIGTDGYLVAGPLTTGGAAARPGTLHADVEASSTLQIGARNHALDDRRPELY